MAVAIFISKRHVENPRIFWKAGKLMKMLGSLGQKVVEFHKILYLIKIQSDLKLACSDQGSDFLLNW